LIAGRKEHIRIFTAERRLLEQMAGFSMYQGVLGVGRLPDPLSLEAILEGASRPYLLAAGGGPDELGEPWGAGAELCRVWRYSTGVGETCSSPFLRRAIRSSMGTVFRLPVFESDHLTHTLMCLRRMGIRIVAAHPNAR